jgi:hypothetical protein
MLGEYVIPRVCHCHCFHCTKSDPEVFRRKKVEILLLLIFFTLILFVIKLQNLTNWLECNEAHSQGEYNVAPLQ